jgi:hypothetical protein
MEKESDYLSRRAREEQAAADRACDPKVRDLHLELAARYRQAAGEGSERTPERPPVPPQTGLPSDFRILE